MKKVILVALIIALMIVGIQWIYDDSEYQEIMAIYDELYGEEVRRMWP
jgi:hypothetical protein